MAEYSDGEHGIWLVVPPVVGLPLLLGTVGSDRNPRSCCSDWPHEVVPEVLGRRR